MFHLPKLGKKITTRIPNIVYLNFLKQRLQTVHTNHVKNFCQNKPESNFFIFFLFSFQLNQIPFQKPSHHLTI